MRLFKWTVFLAFIITVSCKKYDINGKLIKDYEEIDKSKWLLGNWQKVDSSGILLESWSVQNDSTMVGSSYFITSRGDTIHSEAIELSENQEHLIYTATIKGENNDNPIPFLLTESTDSLLLFENVKHDYPKKIKYKLNSNKTITATISGKVGGQESSETYSFIKI